VVTCWYSDHTNLIFRMPTGLPCSHILWCWIFGITDLISSMIALPHPCSSLRSSGTIEFHVQMADFRRGVRNDGPGQAAGPPSNWQWSYRKPQIRRVEHQYVERRPPCQILLHTMTRGTRIESETWKGLERWNLAIEIFVVPGKIGRCDAKSRKHPSNR
jgi:hypothetical protein